MLRGRKVEEKAFGAKVLLKKEVNFFLMTKFFGISFTIHNEKQTLGCVWSHFVCKHGRFPVYLHHVLTNDLFIIKELRVRRSLVKF